MHTVRRRAASLCSMYTRLAGESSSLSMANMLAASWEGAISPGPESKSNFLLAHRRRHSFETSVKRGLSASASPSSFRTEVDLLGSKEVPSDALYGIATQRAIENYDITGVRLNQYPEFIRALGMTKKACARANHQLGLLSSNVYALIDDACDAASARDRCLLSSALHYVSHFNHQRASTSLRLETSVDLPSEIISEPR